MGNEDETNAGDKESEEQPIRNEEINETSDSKDDENHNTDKNDGNGDSNNPLNDNKEVVKSTQDNPIDNELEDPSKTVVGTPETLDNFELQSKAVDESDDTSETDAGSSAVDGNETPQNDEIP